MTSFALSPLFAELQTRGWSRELAVALAVLAVAAVGVLYAKEAGRLSVGRRLALAGVRMLTVLVVAFLLTRPVWVADSGGDKKRPVAVLIDASQSMDSKDPRTAADDVWRAALAYDLIEPNKPLPTDPPTPVRGKFGDDDRPRRIEVARKALTNPRLDLLNKLRAAGPLEVSTFGGTRTGRDSGAFEWLKALAADQPRTAIVGAAMELLNRDSNERPAAIVIVTDGRENGGGKGFAELAAKAREVSVPLHIYGVGSASFGQLKLRDAPVPESVFLDDLVAIPVRYAIRGMPEGGTVDIVVKYGDREVAAKRGIVAQEGEDLREILTFAPSKEDLAEKRQEVTVTVTVTPAAGGGAAVETLTDALTKPTQIVSKKLKVLVVDGLPRVDFKFLQRALLRDRRVDARFFLTEGDREAMKSGYPWLLEFTRQIQGTLSLDRDEFRKLLNEYDLLIFGDVPAKFFTGEHQQVIKDFVTEGGGMIHVAGKWNGPRSWVETADPRFGSIADVLPVELPAEKFPILPPEGRYVPPFVPVIAPNMARNPLVALEEDAFENADLWGRMGERANANAPRAGGKKDPLQPLDWHYPVTRLKPGAETFLVHPTARTPAPDNKPMPLLVGHYYGKGYVLFCAFDDTWRWRFNEADKYFGRFWSQCVYQAGVPRMVGTKLTQLSLDTPEPQQGKSGQVYARVLDDKFKPLAADKLEAVLEKVGAAVDDPERLTTLALQKLDGQDGEYVTPLPFNKAGRYKLTVDPRNGAPGTLEYRVGLPPDHEQSPGALALAELKKLAADSGDPEKPGRFYHEENLHEMPGAIEPQLAPYSTRDETILWNRWALFLLIGLLALEWFLRKFNGLS